MSDTAPTVLVQGASRGIGLALVEALLASVPALPIVATCRRPAAATVLTALAAEHGAKLCVLPLDVTDEASIMRAAQVLQAEGRRLSLLVNCAGFLHEAGFVPERRLAEVEAEHLQRAFAVNAIGPLLVAKHCAPLFDREARAVLANLSARVGSIGDNQLGGWYAYRASKAALNMLTRNLSIELRRRYRGLICVALHPGTVATGLSAPFNARLPAARLFSPARAARQLLEVIARLEDADNGQFFAWDGSHIAW